ncbi:MAG: ankyrin repeat domain-containing protein [Candidatus Riflebacteria bacterium]|nr:ankyrin repeat domain-containing protein [Candidatus Riflebacteria bacterium]
MPVNNENQTSRQSKHLSRQEIFNFLSGSNAKSKLSVLQSVFLELPPEVDADVFQLIKDLADDPDIGVRFWAKRVIAKHFMHFEKSAAQYITKKDNDENISDEILFQKLNDVKKSRFLAINVLKKICEKKNPDSLNGLIEYLNSCNDNYQISFLTKSIGVSFPMESTLKILVPYLKHPDDRVIANTIEGIEAIASPTSFAICSRFLGHTSNRVRANAAKAVAKFDSGKAYEVLNRMLVCKSQPHLLISACYAIKELKDSRFLVPLKELIKEDILFDEVLSTILVIDKKNGIPFLASHASTLDEKSKKIWQSISNVSSFSNKFSTIVPDIFSGIKENLSLYFDWKKVSTAAVLLLCTPLFLFLLNSGWQYLSLKSSSPSNQEARKELEKMKIPFTTEEFLQNMQADNLNVVDLFLKAGMNPNPRDSNGATPLHFSSYCGQEALVQKLLSAGANPEIQDNSGLSPLHLTSGIKIAELLISHGANVNLKDKKGRTPLHKAIENKSLEICKLLISKKADPNIQDIDGHSALHLAAISGQEKIIMLLLANGAKKNIKNLAGKSPSQLGDSTLLK